MKLLAAWHVIFGHFLVDYGLVWDALIILGISAIIAVPIALIIKAISDKEFEVVFKPTFWTIFAILFVIDMIIVLSD